MSENRKITELEISRPGLFGASTSATLALLTTPYEILDRTRVMDERVIYSAEALNCELDYLPQFLRPNSNLYELNHLCNRLAPLSN